MTNSPTPDRHVSEGWPAAHERLTETPQMMAGDVFLIIGTKGTNRYIQFSSYGSAGMRSETVANVYLEGDERLTAADLAMLGGLGWNTPTAPPEIAQEDEHGSPNHFVDWRPPVRPAEVAELAIRTFIVVHAVAHPCWLDYEAFHADGTPIVLPGLKIKRRRR